MEEGGKMKLDKRGKVRQEESGGRRLRQEAVE